MFKQCSQETTYFMFPISYLPNLQDNTQQKIKLTFCMLNFSTQLKQLGSIEARSIQQPSFDCCALLELTKKKLSQQSSSRVVLTSINTAKCKRNYIVTTLALQIIMLSNLNLDWGGICVLFRLYGSLKTIEPIVRMEFFGTNCTKRKILE